MADDSIPEMVRRVGEMLGCTPIPYNPYTLRDLLIHAISIKNGPAARDQRIWNERCVDNWLQEFARVAIKEMREPTGDMIDAGAESFGGYIPGTYNVSVDRQPSKSWVAMIDAALGE